MACEQMRRITASERSRYFCKWLKEKGLSLNDSGFEWNMSICSIWDSARIRERIENNYTIEDLQKYADFLDISSEELLRLIGVALCKGYNEPNQSVSREKREKKLPPRNPIEDTTIARNRILFGAPGTGKSYTLNTEKEKYFPDDMLYERVTFHPEYSYAHFVGSYKPVPEGKEITYKYVPGPFMRLLAMAMNHPDHNFLLIIEEINRANVAAVFGDVFQLLDRNEDGESEYAIAASEDMRRYLQENVEVECGFIKIPKNLYLWATMNSADQGVFPMDTAFKRRWEFEYLGIDDGDKAVQKTVTVANEMIQWNALRKAINDRLAENGINEDKQLGPYFLSMSALEDADTFAKAFKNKVIMYLFEDAARQKRSAMFKGCDAKEQKRYSQICDKFDKDGIAIFKFSDDERRKIVKEGQEETTSTVEEPLPTVTEESNVDDQD